MYQFFLIFLFIIVISRFTFAFSPPKSCRKPKICSDGVPIEYPFYNGDQINFSNHEMFCGYIYLALYCDENGKTVHEIQLNPTSFLRELIYVVNISIPSKRKLDSAYYGSIDLVDFNVLDNECPRPKNQTESYLLFDITARDTSIISIFYNCSLYPPHLPHITCLEYNTTKRSYAFQGESLTAQLSAEGTPQGFDWYGNCEEYVQLNLGRLIPGNFGRVFDTESFRSTLQLGITFQWKGTQYCDSCEGTGGTCVFDSYSSEQQCRCHDGNSYSNESYSDQVSPICKQTPVAATTPAALNETKARAATAGFSLVIKIIMGVAAGILGVLLVLFLVYRKSVVSSCKNTHYFKHIMKNPTNVDLFLESYGGLSLQRYRYSDVKRMTNSFRDTLGQGGYGTVFKGKLLDGSIVAVKVLKESKGNGEEFINEVATIGRTNHINVVRLLGFCSDRSKRALVYEFLTNGSLERFIHDDDNKEQKSSTSSLSLGWDKLYQIALGIAKGLEYLHTGCNTRILHFDIKPHNILLDDNFCPKISDFGLAKICPTRETVVSMLAGRGTIGYIAPEVCCRNFGGVSYKSDVYSYGMMMLEMIGGRKNIDVNAGNTSEIYFPLWVYNHLQRDVIVEASEEVFKEEITRKMILVALWCIQTHPKSRPSMSKVVEMLEGGIENLELPPNPFAESPPSSTSMM